MTSKERSSERESVTKGASPEDLTQTRHSTTQAVKSTDKIRYDPSYRRLNIIYVRTEIQLSYF